MGIQPGLQDMQHSVVEQELGIKHDSLTSPLAAMRL